MAKVQVECSHCGNTLLKYKREKTKRFFCDKICKNKFQKDKKLEDIIGEDNAKRLKQKLSAAFSGDRNPNFGNLWSETQKEERSKLSKEIMSNEEIRFKAGSANRGKKFSKERIIKMHGHRTKESYSRPMSEETKKLIGEKSKEKWSLDYAEKYRKTMEDRGYWTPRHLKTDYEIYFAESNWVHNMYSIIEQIDNSIKQKVRDHIVPRWVGFNYKIFPEIIRHPVNCQIISNAENIKKGFDDRNYEMEYWEEKINKLFYDIQNYSGKYWFEHEQAVKFVNHYLNGFRWDNTFKKGGSDV